MLGLLILICGLGHYLIVRGQLPLFGLELGLDLGLAPVGQALTAALPQAIHDSFPTFAFVAGLILIHQRLAPAPALRRAGLWLLLAIALEAVQLLPGVGLLAGTFDGGDIIAAALGVGFALLLTPTSKSTLSPRLRPAASAALAAFALAMNMATSEGIKCAEEKDTEINAGDVKWSEARPIKRAGKVEPFGDYLLVIEGKDGIHVVDNADVSAPKNIGFVVVPGSIDLATKDQIVYVNAYQHLFTLDLTALPAIEVVDIKRDALGKSNDICYSGGYGFSSKPRGPDEDPKLRTEDRFEIVGDELYAAKTAGMVRVPVQEPAKPGEPYGFNATEDQETSVHYFAPYLYVGGRKNYQLVARSAGDEPPKAVAPLKGSDRCSFVAAAGDTAYIATHKSERCPEAKDELKVVDISNPDDQKIVTTLTPSKPLGVLVVDQKLALCSGDQLKLYSLADPEAPIELTSLPRPGCTNIVKGADDTIIINATTGISQYIIDGDTLELQSELPFVTK